MKKLLTKYIKDIANETINIHSTENSYYGYVKELFTEVGKLQGRKIEVTSNPKKTIGGNPDFRVWDGEYFIIGYIEAKLPGDLDNHRHQEQFDRYISTFPNVILSDFYQFRLYQDGQQVDSAVIARQFTARMKQIPNLENQADFERLIERFFEYKLPRSFTAEQLAIQLAKRTRYLRDIIYHQLQDELPLEKGDLYKYYKAFQKFLIPSLEPNTFSDLYAQTITYGLFAARTRTPETEKFTRRKAFDYIPHTVGVLRDLFRYISLEEPLEQMKIIIDDISAVLNASDINNILDQYYKQGKGEDPIIHFYETFLNEYDPATRESRGVYYTPEPVVKYIVRSVHELLKSEFGLADGLATDGVTLLDPAAGTLTFPAEAIKLAVQEYVSKYGEGGKEGFIRNHILPNFYAFELMMAPYAIGHMKVAYLLEALGFKMSGEDSFKLYLTNTLEMEDIQQIEVPGIEALSVESHNAGLVKKEPILVILGNPPYSGTSSNISPWTDKLLKTDLDGAQSYYKVDDAPLKERNSKMLQDDYVKFLRFAQWKIQKAGKGIVAMITNHAWLDNPTFRGMRQSLMRTFDQIYVLDLHGNSMKKETAPDGGKDENVFDIRVGVAISLFVKTGKKKDDFLLDHSDLYGLRQEKYSWLETSDCSLVDWDKLDPKSEFYLFSPIDEKNLESYKNFPKITQLFPVNSTGIKTHRDTLVIDQDKLALLRRIENLKNPLSEENTLRLAYNIKDVGDWNLREARNELGKVSNIEDYIEICHYRPFDDQYIFYHESLITRSRMDVMRHMQEKNLCLITVRQVAEGVFNHALIGNSIVESRITLSNKGMAFIFPLYLYPDPDKTISFLPLDDFPQPIHQKTANIDQRVLQKLEQIYDKTISPEEFLYYVYAVLYSPTYRETYAPFLKIDYPRIPFTSDVEVFEGMARLGERLKDLHLLQSKELEDSVVRFQGQGDNTIKYRRYDPKQKRLYINENYYFENLEPEVWEYQIGGYQVLDKYIKDRKGQALADPRHIIRISTALAKTIEIQSEIDELFLSVEQNPITM